MTARAKSSVPGVAVLSFLKLSVFKFAQPETTFHARLHDLMTLYSQYGFEGTILTLVLDVLSCFEFADLLDDFEIFLKDSKPSLM
jgi:hypothetical protein